MANLTLICLLAFTGAAQAEPYSETFTKITGIEPGLYRLVDGPKTCLAGDLVLKDKVSKIDGRPGIAFVLGSRSLASFLGGRDKGGERALKWTSDSTVTASRVEYHKTGTQNGSPRRWELIVTPKPDGFKYKTELDGEDVECELSR